MNKPVTKKDGLYKEALAWMSYRYAMGMTDYVSRKGYSELERYRQFMDIEFGSYEFRALVNAFCAFLKRKKIKDVITLKETYLEQDLIFIPYFDTWQYDYSSEGKLKYKKVKRPLDKFRIEPWAAWSINEECIVEDNIENYNRKE